MTMADVLTPQQQQAVSDRGGRLLVSAAAGSGKTKVLVDRLMGYLKDPAAPANLDDFLIITYTKAAAAELRGKIAARLTDHIATEPENRHLQKQMQRLYLAKISTVHAFCGDILRQYAYQLDIPADFRVADENECAELRAVCMEHILDHAYSEEMENSQFRAFVDSQGLGRDDRLVPEIVLKVFDSARCHLSPERWLEECLENARASDIQDASQTVWGSYLMNDLFHWLDLQTEALKECIRLAECSGNMEKPAANLSETLSQFQHLRQSCTWDEIVQRKNVAFGTLTFTKKADEVLKEKIKAVRGACKSGLSAKCKSFQDPSSIVLSDLAETASAMGGIIFLVRAFSREYERAKQARHIMDFGDLEQAALDLLLGRHRSGMTSAAREIAAGFREIMVDEYQDSNEVQDAIFECLSSQKQNCFMVGDVKQSIYQFRLADPGIFLRKYESYVHAEQARQGEGRKVFLSRNFRSGGAVLSAVNDVFYTCMTRAVGGVSYNAQEALVEGVSHTPLGGPEVELQVVDVQHSTYDEEASAVARRIQSLLDGTHMVRDGSTLRPVREEDIAILLRSPNSSAGYFTAALSALGIPFTTGGGDDLLQASEIQSLRALLSVLSNPRQDIPLLATLTSPVFGFTADDLAVLRAGKRSGCIYDALKCWDTPKARRFVTTITALRRSARLLSLAELLQHIYETTRVDSIYAAMPDGEIRKRNLLAFYELAAGFSSGGHRDLEQFLQYLSVMEGKGIITGRTQTVRGCVTVMSIHKSKGLEFPVVIAAGLSRQFNRESLQAQVLCDQSLGLGLSVVDRKNRVRYPTIAKRAIGVKAASDSLSEEMRVLYVALTRARDRLIMSYAVKNPEKDLGDFVNRMDIGSRELLTADAVCPGDWVMLAALRRSEAGALFGIAGKPAETAVSPYPWDISLCTAEPTGARVKAQQEPEKIQQELLDQMRRGIAYCYPYPAATAAPSKQTATDRKGRQKDEEAHALTVRQQQTARYWRYPFEERDAASYGTAMHLAMQYLDFSGCTGEKAIAQQLDSMERRGLLSSSQRQMVSAVELSRFFKTDLGLNLSGSLQVLREFKFSILDDGTNYDSALKNERILLQGVVDCAIVEADGITIVDFKTDRVTEETLMQRAAQYAPQVQTYRDALSRIFRMPVKRTVLYFFHLHRLVDM